MPQPLTETTPSPGPPPSKASALAIRLLVAPLILAVVIGVLYLQHESGETLGTDLLLLLMGAAGGYELACLLRFRAPGVLVVLGTAACGLLGGVGFAGDDASLRMTWRVLVVLAAFLVLLMRHMRDVRPEALTAITFSIAPVLYVGLPFSFMRELLTGPDGALRCLYVVLIAKGSDIGGWVVGKPFGRHKLIPSVSPGKSWEGLAGGLLLSVLVAVFLAGPFGIAEADWTVAGRVGFGLLLGIASLLAGITQSGWKRRVGAKDSSTLIPEMGGVLDMIDSLLFAAPVAWAVYQLAGVS